MTETNYYHECPNIAHQVGQRVGRTVRHFVLGFREQQYVSDERKILNLVAQKVTEISTRLQEVMLNQGAIMGQVDDLRAAITENADAAEEAVSRVEAKLAELGEPDPDLTADIATIRAATAQIKTIADPTTPDPGDEGFDPGTVVGGGDGEDTSVDEGAETAPSTDDE